MNVQATSRDEATPEVVSSIAGDQSSLSWENKWENKSQMMGFLANFLELNKNPDFSSLISSPIQTSGINEVCQSNVQDEDCTVQLPQNRQAAYSAAFAKLEERRSLKTNPFIQQGNHFTATKKLSLACQDSYRQDKIENIEPTITQTSQHFLNPFAFGEPMEFTPTVPVPSGRQAALDAAAKELDTFSQAFAFEDKIEFKQSIPGLDVCRSKTRRDESDVHVRPQKKIRTTFGVAQTEVAKNSVNTFVKCDLQPAVTTAPLKVARKRKNNRERQRRQGLNQKFQELIEVLAPHNDRQSVLKVGVGSKGPKWNKQDILSEAIYSIKDLRARLQSTEARLASSSGFG